MAMNKKNVFVTPRCATSHCLLYSVDTWINHISIKYPFLLNTEKIHRKKVTSDSHKFITQDGKLLTKNSMIK